MLDPITVGMVGLLAAPLWSLAWLLFAGAEAGMSMVTCLSFFNLRARDHHQASSLSAMGQCIGSAAGPFLVGWLHGATGSWSAPYRCWLWQRCCRSCLPCWRAVTDKCDGESLATEQARVHSLRQTSRQGAALAG